jgi:hypothetical protein
MPNLFERLKNVVDDHQERERQGARIDGYRQALNETKDALLASALAIKADWQSQLMRGGDADAAEQKYSAKLNGLNAAFDTLNQLDPRMKTQVNVDQIRASVTAKAQEHAQEITQLRQLLRQQYDDMPGQRIRMRL